jgi:hypothetical protein
MTYNYVKIAVARIGKLVMIDIELCATHRNPKHQRGTETFCLADASGFDGINEPTRHSGGVF